MELITGVMYHAVGASSASLCYTPQKKVKGWSWQTYWLAQALVCWLLMPVLVAWLTIPQLPAVLHEAPSAVLRNTFLLGMAYGIGGTAFGMAIRYVGFSLTYAISVGISCVLGTMIPLIIGGEHNNLFDYRGVEWIIAGTVLGAAGIAVCGVAGRGKEKDLGEAQAAKAGFSLAKGLPLCLLAGVLSAFYGFSLEQGQPVAKIAERYGAGNFQNNAVYIFSNAGAFLTTLIYCLYLHAKEKTFKEYTTVPAQSPSSPLMLNFAMAALTGILWYGQFFFYGLGHVRMGNYKFSSWAIHMIMLVLFSSVAGLLLKEWKNTSSNTRIKLAVALAVLAAAVIVIAYGNHLGGRQF